MPVGEQDAASDVTSCGEYDDVLSDVSEATAGLEEEERCRRLFSAFDANDDGFLDKADLERMCRALALDEQAAPLILSQLGADDHGQVSCADFLRAWLALRAEVDRLRQPAPALAPASDPTLTAGADTHGDCVSWSSGVTSGDPADPALQPDSLLALLERSGHLAVGDPPPLLSEADKLHQAALASVRSELAVTSARLGHLSEENGHLQRSLTRTLRERARCEREAAARLSETEERYEQRLVELHSVVAELSRALQVRRDAVIAEEDEESGAESAALDDDESPAEGERPAARGGAAEDKACQMTEASEEEPAGLTPSPLSAGAAVNLSPRLSRRLEPLLGRSEPAEPLLGRSEPAEPLLGRSELTEPLLGRSELTEPLLGRSELTDALPSRLELLQQEVCMLRKENSRLQDRVGRQEAEINRSRIASESAVERGKLRRQVSENPADGGGGAGAPPSPATARQAAVPRMAERVRLRQSSSGVTGSELSACGVQSTRVAEQLVEGYSRDWSAVQERPPQERLMLAELELERLRARLEHAQAAADVSALALQAARAQADHLAALCGKYESNCVALQLANEQSDQLTEAFDVLVALQDSELALLLASCRAAGLGLSAAARPPPGEAETALRVAGEQRRSCENVARHTLSRLERSQRSGGEEAGSHDTSTTSSSSSGVDVDSAKSDETRLRQHVQRLKVARALVARTAVQLESTCHQPPAPPPLLPAAVQRLDLEHAVLMQELTALREDRAELRSRLFLAERERAGLELKLAACVAAERAHRLQLQQLRDEPSADAEQPSESDLAESVGSGSSGSPSRREMVLRSRLRQLTAGLDDVTRTAEARQQHSDEFVAELKRANGALADALEKTKRKYQAKLKRLEQQMLQIVERHSAQQSRGSRPGPAGCAASPSSSAPESSPLVTSPEPQPLVTSPEPPPTSPEPGCRLPVMSPAHRPGPGRVTSPALARFLASPPPPPPRLSSPARGAACSPTRRLLAGPVRVAPPVPPKLGSPKRGAAPSCPPVSGPL